MPEIRSDVGRAASQPLSQQVSTHTLSVPNLVCQSNGRPSQMGARLFSGKMNELIPDKPPTAVPSPMWCLAMRGLFAKTNKRKSFAILLLVCRSENTQTISIHIFAKHFHSCGNFRECKEMTKITQSTHKQQRCRLRASASTGAEDRRTGSECNLHLPQVRLAFLANKIL